MRRLTGGQFWTVILIAGVGVRLPAASKILAFRVCGPLVKLRVSSAKVNGEDRSVADRTPSTRRRTSDTPTLSRASTVTATVPLTMAPLLGLVIEPVGATVSTPLVVVGSVELVVVVDGAGGPSTGPNGSAMEGAVEAFPSSGSPRRSSVVRRTEYTVYGLGSTTPLVYGLRTSRGMRHPSRVEFVQSAPFPGVAPLPSSQTMKMARRPARQSSPAMMLGTLFCSQASARVL